MDSYIDELVTEVSQPSAAELERADEIARRLHERALAIDVGIDVI